MFSRENVMKNKQVGNIGEDAALKYLSSKGYRIIERNYRRAWGEIDIVAQKGKKVHFVEVKSISRENMQKVSQNAYRPEENFHVKKQDRFLRIAQTYVEKHAVEQEWQLDLITIEIIIKDKKVLLNHIENVL